VEVFAIQPRCFFLCDRRRHPDPGPAQGGDPFSFDHGIGVSHRYHHPAHTGLNNCRYAWWGSFEEVATGLERDIERRAYGMSPCLVERKNFRVGLPWTVMIPAADDPPVLDYKGTNHGIRAGLTLAHRRKTKRQGHEVEVRCGDSHRFLRVTRDWLRSRWADFVFAVFVAAFFARTRDAEALRVGRELLDPASANAAWAAASRAMATR
jgi:hypothetical protein